MFCRDFELFLSQIPPFGSITDPLHIRVEPGVLLETNKDGKTLVSVVVPIYREENNVEPLVDRLKKIFEKLDLEWELIFALDPSPDSTEQKINSLIDRGAPIRLITFSRRIGKPLSLVAGLDHVTGDACIVIDADLQDPPELIEEMISEWRNGYKVVAAQRVSRKGESFLYLKSAELFYWILDKFSDVKIPRNTGDFRLLDARVVSEICRIRERHGFLRGMNALAGFPTKLIPFDRDPRLSGKTQISLMGALNIALDGIVPFSRAPLRMIFVLGALLLGLSAISTILWILSCAITGPSPNWPSILLAFLILLCTGICVTCMGVLGEYLMRTYEETRDRPLYVVDKIVESESISRKLAEKLGK